MASKREVCEKYKVSGGWSLGAFASLQIHVSVPLRGLNMMWMILFIVAMCMTIICRQAITS